MDEKHSENQPPDDSSERSRLECIGSFKAYSRGGEAYTIEVWTHFGSVYDRNRARVAPGLLVLTTTDGHGVERIDQGEYRLKDRPEISLSTDDPTAP